MSVIKAIPGIALFRALLAMMFLLAAGLPEAMAEGSRSLYPAAYPNVCGDAAGQACRADLDVLPEQKYLGKLNRRTFLYVYAEAGEYILLGSRNRDNGGDIQVYNPQAFGIPGDETIPAAADYSCAATPPAGSFGGAGRGLIGSRAAELAGPNSADGSATVGNGFLPCAYRAPVTGLYGVVFSAATNVGSGPDGSVAVPGISNESVSAWDVTVRSTANSLTDINGRLFTYVWAGNTGGSGGRPVFSTHYYISSDGYRYAQDLRGLDPIGYALYANSLGFLDNGQPLFKDIRGNEAQVTTVPAGVTTQIAQYPIFFSEVRPNGPNEAQLAKVLAALNIPATPAEPSISNLSFSGHLGGSETTPGAGGTIQFDTTNTITYEVVISRDGENFDPAIPGNRVLSGSIGSGTAHVTWDGKDNSGVNFPVGAYKFRARGHNGDIHFPMIDVENNPGKGPTITRLNGADGGSTRVYYDDRGYRTDSGVLVGNLNGTLCDAPVPAGPSVPVSLTGVDSRTDYRGWASGSNANSDCSPTAGWGDAKGLNLWTYFSTPDQESNLTIRETSVDVATSLTVPDAAAAGTTVPGTVSFSNNGTGGANGISYGLSLSPGLSNVSFGNLPAGATASYDGASGIVTLAGLPASLAPGQSIPAIDFSYTAPAVGPVVVTSSIATTDPDTLPGNNTATASTGIGSTDVLTSISVPVSVAAGGTVNGSFSFSNNGGTPATGVSYTASIGTPGVFPASVSFTGLPTGVTAVYSSTTGQISFTGLPTTLAPGQSFNFGFSYTAPASGSVPVNTAIATSSPEANTANNTATASTSITAGPSTATISGTVFSDTNEDKIQNGAETGTSAGGRLFVTAVSGGNAVTSVAVGPDGSFSLEVPPNATYTLVLSTDINKTVPSLPPAWRHTGENSNGVPDAVADGILTVAVASGPVGQQGFGIVPFRGPLANNDTATTTLNTPVLVPVAANDSADPASGLDLGSIDLDPAAPGQQTSVTVPGEGSFSLDPATGRVLFTPVPGFVGVVTVSYTIADTTGRASNTANITVTVRDTPLSAKPIANDDLAVTPQGTAVSIPASANDVAGTGQTLNPGSLKLIDPADGLSKDSVTTAEGQWFANDPAGGSVRFVPVPGFTGTATLDYTIADNAGTVSDQATISVRVNGGNAPRASDDSASTRANTPVAVSVLNNDTPSTGRSLLPGTVDLDPGTPAIDSTRTTPEGVWSVDPAGVLTFTPTADFQGSGRPFTGVATAPYTVSDGGEVRSNSATVTVVVNPDAVTAVNDIVVTPEGIPVDLLPSTNDSAAPGAVLDPSTVDLDPSTPDTVDRGPIVTPQGTWQVTDNGGTVRFTPAPGFIGDTSRSYAIRDSLGNRGTAVMTVTVTASDTGGPTPNPPDAVDQQLQTPFNTPVGGNVTTQGSIPPGSSITLNSNPGNGSVTLNPDGSFTYVPKQNFTGTDFFTYRVCLAPPNQGLCDTATVSIIVGASQGAVPGITDFSLRAGRTAIRCGRAVVLKVSGAKGKGKLVFTTVAEGAVSCRVKKSAGKYYLRTAGTPPGSCTVTATKRADRTHAQQVSNSVTVNLR